MLGRRVPAGPSTTVLVLVVACALPPRATFADWPSSPLANVAACTASGFQTNVQVITDGSGGVITAWVDQRNGNNDIYASRILASGNVDPAWPANGRAVCIAAAGQLSQRMVSDGAGGAFIVWQDFRNGATDIFAHHVLGTGSLDPAWPINGLAICTADSSQLLPQVVGDVAGGILIAWSDLRNGVDLKIYAHRVLGSGSLDPGWPANGLQVSGSAGAQQNPSLIPDGSGGCIVAWGDLRNGASDIYAQRLGPGGMLDPAWPAGGLAVCTFTGGQIQPVLAPDGAGGALAAWVDMRAGASNIYAAHLLTSGAIDPAWPTDGLALCTATGDQTLAVIAATATGEAVVTWMDARGATLDIYAQRVSAAGTALWTADGQPVCVAGGEQRIPAVAPDGLGGATVAWQDRRGATADIYAQRLPASGVPSWTANGVAVSTAAGNQEAPKILADGAGGAIIAWQDNRNAGDYDVYAQRVQPDGQLGGTVVGVDDPADVGLGLSGVFPNPSRAGTLRVSFTLAGSEAALDLIDLSGRRVASKDVSTFGAGRHATLLRLEPSLATGIYFLVLRQNGHFSSRRIVVVE